MTDASDVGRYGTIRLMKATLPEDVVAAYPIDDEVVTFGRDPTCNVRLYYQWVSNVHCKVIFEDRKAFLQVMGGNGVVVDGCQVLPIRSGIDSEPTTIPLINGSNFVIHNKRFVFSYPPKELRPQLFTPAAKRRGSLRLSMITSAQVFSPRPSMNPKENLRVLQSPLRPFAGSPTGDEVTVKLVDGNHPKVVEEGQDLVILENVETVAPMTINLSSQPQVTPRKKSMPSLHRAVLIRSAQRVQQQMHHRQTLQDVEEALDPELLDAEEEEEVEEAISAFLSNSEESEEDVEERDAMLLDGNEGDEPGVEEDQQLFEGGEEQTTPTKRSLAMLDHKPMPSLFSRLKDDVKTPRKSGPQRPPPGARFSLVPELDDRDGPSNSRTVAKDEAKDELKMLSSPMRPTVSAEERQAIIERRKSAMKGSSSDFEHVPGTRRTSALPPPLQQSPFKKIGKGIDDGEDTKAVLAKMQETLEDMRNKKAVGTPGSPGIGRGQGLLSSPSKPTFSLLARGASPRAPSPVFKPDQSWSPTPLPKEALKKDADDDMKDANVAPSTTDGPRTPKLEGIRDLFRAPAAILATPSFRGVRELFGKTDGAPKQVHTPRLDGIRNMFAEAKEIESPRYDGIEDMMAIPEETVDSKASTESNRDEEFEAPKSDVSKPKKASAVPKAPARTRRTKGNATDSSIMADDEASVLLDIAEGTKRPQVPPIPPHIDFGIQRVVRPRRAKTPVTDDDMNHLPEPTKAKSSRRAKTPIKSEEESTTGCEGSTSVETTHAMTGPKPRRKTAAASSADDSLPAPKTRRRPIKKSTDDEGQTSLSENPKATKGRQTRSRAAIVDQHDEDPLDSLPRESSPQRAAAPLKSRRGTRTKPSVDIEVDESIPEIDEQDAPQHIPPRKALGRSRQAKDASSEVEDITKKRQGVGRKKNTESIDAVQGKENTPEPASPIEVGNGEKKTFLKATRVKTETTTTAIRSTRTRSRK